ncbi:MAG: Calx-beta domain-containing protein, partial [Campylobacterota bacterium]|nr:Calx-beta domain-containing protein [Campylobacterota bacterium]
MATLIATVGNIEGTFYAKGVDGVLRELKIGDTISEGETIVGSPENSSSDAVTVTLASDGSELVVAGIGEQLFDASLLLDPFNFEDVTADAELARQTVEEQALDMDGEDELASLLDDNEASDEDEPETAADEEAATGANSSGGAFLNSIQNEGGVVTGEDGEYEAFSREQDDYNPADDVRPETLNARTATEETRTATEETTPQTITQPTQINSTNSSSAERTVETPTSTEVVDQSILTTEFIDSAVSDVTYSTTSGLSGNSGDSGVAGEFSYRASDTVTFKIGDVTLGEFSADVIQGDKLFLADIAGTYLGDTNNEYVENMAIFLQMLDEDGDATNGITISDATKESFIGYEMDMATEGKQALSDALAHVGIEFKPGDEGLLFEQNAVTHVQDTITELAENRGDINFDTRVEDQIDVNNSRFGFSIENVDGANQVTFSKDDLLSTSKGIQVTTDNIKVTNVNIKDVENYGELIDNGDDTYTLVLNDGITKDDLDALPIVFDAQDWNASIKNVEAKLEALENIHVNLTGNDFYANEATVGIEDNDANPTDLPLMSIDYQYAVEGDEFAEYTVSLDKVSDTDITVEYYTSDFGAKGGEDFGAVTGTLTIPAGQLSATIQVPITDDMTQEDMEMAFVNIKNADGAAIADMQGSLRIFDNDVDKQDITITKDADILESDSIATFNVSLENAYDTNVLLDFSINSSTPNSNYEFSTDGGATWKTLVPADGEGPKAGKIFLEEGISEFKVRAQISDDDSVVEADSNITLSIGGYAVNETATATVNIIDDDAAPVITISDDTDNDGTLNGSEISGTTTITIALPLATVA